MTFIARFLLRANKNNKGDNVLYLLCCVVF